MESMAHRTSLKDAPPGPTQGSPFFQSKPTAEPGSLAILHLKRDSLLPVILRESADDGYAEGAVTNTRFGSFPHSTILGLPWGSQVRASKVDTGSRGRKDVRPPRSNGDLKGSSEAQQREDDSETSRKRKGEDSASGPLSKKAKRDLQMTESDSSSPAPQRPIEAGSGFTHILPPTPEAWTSSLDHRTQVVYTPDYSYILQRLKVRPGDTIIEAGAGSGSFTHAAARAVFNGYPSNDASEAHTKTGRVCSFEYHEPRVHTLEQELKAQGLDSIVSVTHRDVCTDGFVLSSPPSSDPSFTHSQAQSPNASAIFLDLPAPWLALRHLTRSSSTSPLNPRLPVHLCAFSPCIEQVTLTTSHLRRAGWVGIGMVEVQNRRLDVRREQIGLRHEGLRGVNASPADVGESIARLRQVEAKLLDFHHNRSRAAEDEAGAARIKVQSKAERLEGIKREALTRKGWREGNLVHRTEPEVRSHTSYLTFAVLPAEWSEEDERGCEERWRVEDTEAVAEKKGKWKK